jgi:2-amino-4-hydroxy-6-hydroxymethyldihydropteridine diphosphokinase
MAPAHRFYLNLGSNIDPEPHLAEAVRLLRDSGNVNEISSVWESQAVGSDGPNFLNLSVGYESQVGPLNLKRSVVRVIENALGRSRTSDKNAPRTIDIDVLWEDDHPVNIELWMQAFVILPMAELLPQLPHPVTGRPLADEALWAAGSLWIQRRPDVMIPEE